MTGILLLDKPLGMSSNRALQTIKRMLGAVKAGHVGSLDPLATGMLPICLGEATKIAGELLSSRKGYEFTVRLGERTATGDAEGDIVETCPVPALQRDQITAELSRFIGRQLQTPPMYSAIKHQGQPLYKLARAGIELERKAREIEIFDLRLLGCDGSALQLATVCSKGTYVRTLAEDLAKALGTCGHVIQLRRLYVEPFENEAMETVDSVDAALATGKLPRILRADAGLPHLPAVHLDAAATVRLLHGQSVGLGDRTAEGKVRLYEAGGEFLGIGEASGGCVRPRRLFALVGGGVRG
jgi:tRNA pseudouridine55 synthase